MKIRFLAASAVLVCAASALASSSAFSVVGSASFNNIGSIDAQGDLDNVRMNWVATGGGPISAIRVTGQLTEIATATFASEARVRFTAGAGSAFTAFNLQASTTTGYTGSIAIGPSTINVTPFTLTNGGTVGLEWFESAQDGTANIAEQTWDNVLYEFGSNVITNGGASLGSLVGNGSTMSVPGSHASGGLDFFTFSFGGVNAPTDYLNLSMLGGGTGGMTDTEMALYDGLGNLVASSDDEGPGLFSELTYGAADPLAAPDVAPGFNGLSLAAGTYTIVTGGFNTNFTPTIGAITAGTNAGSYSLGVTYVPEPASLALLALGAICLGRRR